MAIKMSPKQFPNSCVKDAEAEIDRLVAILKTNSPWYR